jgi:hypothetical protein
MSNRNWDPDTETYEAFELRRWEGIDPGELIETAEQAKAINDQLMRSEGPDWRRRF